MTTDKIQNEKPRTWLDRAVRAFRDFAYAGGAPQPEPEPLAALPGRPRIGLALGGGFARGIAHLGVLHALEEKKIPIDCIAGTSAGALAAVAFASNLPFEKILKEASAIRFGNFGQWRLSRMGLASNRRLADYPREHLAVEEFKDLRIPLTMTATDLLTGLPVYFDKGPLGPPLCASCAYPGLFAPVEYQGHTLVDGFLSAALPIDGLLRMGADIVVAVFMEAEVMQAPRNVVDVIGRSFSIARLQSDAGWQTKADVIIRPRVQEFAWDDFAKTPELVAAGELAAIAAVPHILARMRLWTEERQKPERSAANGKKHRAEKSAARS